MTAIPTWTVHYSGGPPVHHHLLGMLPGLPVAFVPQESDEATLLVDDCNAGETLSQAGHRVRLISTREALTILEAGSPKPVSPKPPPAPAAEIDILRVEQAVRRLPMRSQDARAWLRNTGLLRDLDGREIVVWGDVIRHLRACSSAVPKPASHRIKKPRGWSGDLADIDRIGEEEAP
jgi:hypothetical protein